MITALNYNKNKLLHKYY